MEVKHSKELSVAATSLCSASSDLHLSLESSSISIAFYLFVFRSRD